MPHGRRQRAGRPSWMLRSLARRCRRASLLTATVVLACAPATAGAAPALPPGLGDELVAAVPQPTAIAFTPPGDMLVTSKDGRVFVKAPGRPLDPTPVLDLRGRVCTDRDQGLVGIAVDPLFAWNRFVYLSYTRLVGRECRTGAVHRVSRFLLSPSPAARALSEWPLLDNLVNRSGIHTGGDLVFGKDELLYVATGDAGCHPVTRACGLANAVAREPHDLLGKLLRVDRFGRAPAENGGDVACALSGRAAPGLRCQEVFASGLRNPFRIALDPDAEGTRLLINDVGQNAAEEINVARLGADYGWPLREGRCSAKTRLDCGNAPPEVTDPLVEYTSRGTGCEAITGGAFVPQTWPAPYAGSYVFADWTCGRIRRLSDAADGPPAIEEIVTDLGDRAPIHLVFGPAPGGHALYYSTFANGGEVRMLFPTTANRRPVAALTAAPVFGALPLEVHFDAAASWDPDTGVPTAYRWRFGDGRRRVTSTPTVAHRYARAGVYTARVVASDGAATSDPVAVRVFAGDRPPVVRVRGPARYRTGQRLRLHATARDPEDGRLDPERLTWSVALHHQRHTHTYVPPRTGSELRMRGPVPEGPAALRTSFLRVQVVATDSQGLTAVATHDIKPRRRRP